MTRKEQIQSAYKLTGRTLCKRKQPFQTHDAAAECQRRLEHLIL